MDTIVELMQAYDMTIQVQLVKSSENIADDLTRVPQQWLKVDGSNFAGPAVVTDTMQKLKQIHETHHFGVDRTYYIAERQIGPHVKVSDIKQIIAECEKCQSIDPSR